MTHTSTSSHPRVYGAGLLALDIVFTPDNGPPHTYAGGTCGNVLTILSYLGWEAFPIARLNGDPVSSRVLADLRRWNVRLDYAKSKPQVPAPVIVEQIAAATRGKAAHRFSFVCPKCGANLPSYRAVHLAAAKNIAARISSPSVFFFDRVSPGTLLLAEHCKDAGAVIVFEPSGIGVTSMFDRALRLSDIVKYSQDRIDRTAVKFRGIEIPLEIETCGSEGLNFRSRHSKSKSRGWRHLPAIKNCTVTDTAGSGDWLTAVLINNLADRGVARLRQLSLSDLIDAISHGQAAAAWNCAFAAARGGMYCTDVADLKKAIAQLLLGHEIPAETFRIDNQDLVWSQPACVSCL